MRRGRIGTHFYELSFAIVALRRTLYMTNVLSVTSQFPVLHVGVGGSELGVRAMRNLCTEMRFTAQHAAP